MCFVVSIRAGIETHLTAAVKDGCNDGVPNRLNISSIRMATVSADDTSAVIWNEPESGLSYGSD